MKKKDDRMNLTTEVINNIKMIKLYSWQETFLKRINEKRTIELKQLKRNFIVSMFSITSFYFFPLILSAVVFTTFIGSGNHLDLGTAFSVMIFFSLIEEPLSFVP